MTTATIATSAPTRTEQVGAGRFTAWLRTVGVLTRRNLIHVRREPAQLSDATIQPVLFTVLFVTIFGSAMTIAGGSYKDFAIGGLVTMNLTTAAMGTAVGLSSDLSTGVINRFRTLPMSRSAILVGRTASDLLASILCASIVCITGWFIGWRPDNGLPGTLAALGVAVLFAWSLSWVTACLGMVVHDPESAQGVALLVLFPTAFISSCFVPTDGLPTWMRVIADWNPVSAVAGACRELMGNPNPAKDSGVWPAEHPVLMSFISVAVILAIAVPASIHLLRKRTTD